MTCCSERKKEVTVVTSLEEHRARLCAEGPQPTDGAVKATSNPILYPMYVVPYDKFMLMTEVVAHQDLKNQGIVIEYMAGTGVVTFVSHQWCGNSHPDPQFHQLKVLQRALNNITSGQVNVCGDFINSTVFQVSEKLSTKEMEDMKSGFIWYDYFSVPQIGARSVHQTVGVELGKAVDSIPGYVEQCQYFFVLAPSVPHQDKVDTIVSYASWRDRGWCRTERTSRALSPGSTNMIRIRSADSIDIIGSHEWLHEHPGKGVFTVDSDKGRVAPIVQALVKGKLEAYLIAGELHNYRLLWSMREEIFEGLPLDAKAAIPKLYVEPETKDPALRFMSDLGFTRCNEVSELGWAPIHYAAVSGDIDVMKGLLALKADVSHATLEDDPSHYLPKGFQPLHICAHFCDKKEPIEFLIDAKADINEWDTNVFKAAPLIFTTVSNKTIACQTLINRGALLDQRNTFGLSALDAAALHMSEGLVKILLDAGASTEGTMDGITPLHFVAMIAGSSLSAKYILEHGKGDINARINLTWTSMLGIVWGLVGPTMYRLGDKSELAICAYNMNKATPLIVASLTGNWDVATELVQAGADKTLRNARGLNAEDIAKMRRYPEEFTTLLSPENASGIAKKPESGSTPGM